MSTTATTTSWLCTNCGVEYPTAGDAPAYCRICDDDRMYPSSAAKRWIPMTELARDREVAWHELEPGLLGHALQPGFCINQRAILASSPTGAVLYDCVAMIDDAAEAKVAEHGKLRAIVPSHPHFYGAMTSWSKRLGGVPIYVHEFDREWVPPGSANVTLWSGDTIRLGDDATIVRIGGHFEGAQVLHCAGADGRGVILAGDTISVARDARWVGFMRSNPNYIPMAPSAVTAIVRALEPFEFDRLYGSTKVVSHDAKGVLRRSAERYIRAVAS
jgi:glyoxylase-like metal-dependent hydrolase (beta-lactamase superfamily II)